MRLERLKNDYYNTITTKSIDREFDKYLVRLLRLPVKVCYEFIDTLTDSEIDKLILDCSDKKLLLNKLNNFTNGKNF